MLNVITGIKEQLTLAVESKCLARLVNFISALKVLLGTLCELSLSSPNNLVQVVYLAEATVRGLVHKTVALSSSQ